MQNEGFYFVGTMNIEEYSEVSKIGYNQIGVMFSYVYIIYKGSTLFKNHHPNSTSTLPRLPIASIAALLPSLEDELWYVKYEGATLHFSQSLPLPSNWA